MAESRQAHEWQMTSSQMWLLAAVNSGKGGRKLKPDDFNPLKKAKQPAGSIMDLKGFFTQTKTAPDAASPKQT